jgi:Tol biopolymer transport system component
MPNGKEVAFLSGNTTSRKIYAVDVETRAERVLFDPYTEINRLFGSKHDDMQFTASFTNDGRYTLMMSNYKTKDRTEIFRIDLETQTIELVASGPYKSTHPVLHPENPDILFYIPEADGQNAGAPDNADRARNWLIRISGNEMKDYTVKGLVCEVKGTAEPFLWMPVGNRATHETWTSFGEKMFYFKKGSGNDVSVCSRSIEDATQTVYATLSRLGHGVTSSDMKYFVSDQQVGANANNALYLIDLETKAYKIISNPNATNSNGNFQYQHVHPSFSRSGNYVIYSSDRRGNGFDGRYQVFVVPISEIAF